MKSRKLRNFTFYLHRVLGWVVGLILIVVGLTGSLLVFEPEISDWLNTQQFGAIIPQEQAISPDEVLKVAQNTYPDWKITNLYFPENDHHPYKLRMQTPNANPDLYLHGDREVFVHPYTGEVLGHRIERFSFYRFLLNLHYRLFAEQIGITIVGISGLILLILSITGLILWPGWRKLLNGFKIKWNGHPQRLGFDLHKVIGITTVVFLILTAFTGFCWNFYDFTQPIIYQLTGTKTLPEPSSTPILGQNTRALKDLVAKADQRVPEGQITSLYIPEEPEGALMVFKKVNDTVAFGGSTVYLDRFSGEVLRIDDERNLQLGDRILNAFYPLHFGTFWGLPSRIIYFWVGLAPLFLFITALVMGWYRKKRPKQSPFDDNV